MFGLMGFLWTFLWIVTYRDTNTSIGNGSTADEEAFIPSTPKVFFIFISKKSIERFGEILGES